jgi:hypothetical protein
MSCSPGVQDTVAACHVREGFHMVELIHTLIYCPIADMRVTWPARTGSECPHCATTLPAKGHEVPAVQNREVDEEDLEIRIEADGILESLVLREWVRYNNAQRVTAPDSPEAMNGSHASGVEWRARACPWPRRSPGQAEKASTVSRWTSQAIGFGSPHARPAMIVWRSSLAVPHKGDRTESLTSTRTNFASLHEP